MERLVVVPVSKASAQQRIGRAGRVRAGKAYRLYTQNAYTHLLPEHTVPEMQRSNLAQVLLQLKAMGVENVAQFNYVSSPPTELVMQALEVCVLPLPPAGLTPSACVAVVLVARAR